MPLTGHGLRPPPLRQRAGRLQLKRDPLGSSHPTIVGYLSMTPLRTVAGTWVERIQAVLPLVGVSSVEAQRIISLFREAGAMSPYMAQPFRARSRMEERTFLHLLHLGAIRQPTRGRYYLDEQVLRTLPVHGVLPWW